MSSTKLILIAIMALCYTFASVNAFTLKSSTIRQRLHSSLHMTSSVPAKKHLKVGLFGCGTVGGGVYDLVQRYTANGRFSGVGASIEISV